MRTTALRVGEEVAGYRVLEFVGAGGMGLVYRALHPGLQRVVALKVIRAEVAGEEAFRERFRREARLIASIDHPCVVPVYDAAEVGGVLFMVMRWVTGSDLRRLLAAEGVLEPARAVHLLGQIAAAADAAHQLNLIHRDIKPGNVLLEGEHAFLSDFGVARLLAQADAETNTITGGFVGTVDYAAPELLDGEAGTAQADVYALGCVFYEMLTGSVPYPAESLLARLQAHAHDKRPVPSARRPDLPHGLDGVVRRCLATDPTERFATGGELAAAAEHALRTPPVQRSGTAHRPRRLRRLVFASTLAGAAAAGLVAAVLTLPSAGPAPYASGGRTLPSPALLQRCGHGLAGPPRTCANPTDGDGVVEIGEQGHAVHMSTMTVELTGAALASRLPILSTGGEVIAPPGTHFVVMDLTVTNVTHSPHEFESSEEIAGRLTMLLLFPSHGGAMSYHGPHFADYSMQYEPADSALPEPLYGAELPPSQPIRGQLVFDYPNSELRTAKDALLEVKELGEPFNVSRSEAMIRLAL